MDILGTYGVKKNTCNIVNELTRKQIGGMGSANQRYKQNGIKVEEKGGS